MRAVAERTIFLDPTLGWILLAGFSVLWVGLGIYWGRRNKSFDVVSSVRVFRVFVTYAVALSLLAASFLLFLAGTPRYKVTPATE